MRASSRERREHSRALSHLADHVTGARRVADPVTPSDALLRFVRAHGAEGILACCMERCTSPDLEAQVDVAFAVRVQALRQLSAAADLRFTGEVFDAAGIDWMLVKGPALASRLYEDPKVRPYDDLDLVVPAQDFATAVQALCGAGARLLDTNWELVHRQGRGQVHIAMPSGTVADLHWHLINHATTRRTIGMPMDDLWSRSRTVEVEGTTTRTLDATDQLLHVCTHAALAGGHRLRWLLDIDRCCAEDPPDWDAVVERARAWSIDRSTAVMLGRSRRVVGATPPDSVIAALSGGRAYALAARAIDATQPEARPDRAGVATIWTQIARPGLFSALLALGHRLVRPVRSRPYSRGRSAGPARARVLEPSRAEGSDRARYFAWVGTTT